MEPLTVLVAALFVAVLLLIMRISQLNDDIRKQDEHLSNKASVDYVNHLFETVAEQK